MKFVTSLFLFCFVFFVDSTSYSQTLNYIDVSQAELAAGNLPFAVSLSKTKSDLDPIAIFVDAAKSKGLTFINIELRICKKPVADRHCKELFIDNEGLQRKEVRNEVCATFHVTSAEINNTFLIISFERDRFSDIYCVRLTGNTDLSK